ncbi:MAG: hypothetical protein KF861_09900 [Planctomycetaceae bacterium]|nr:hypothetical protein [Planctomycetaceae bacterium]
MMIEQRQQISNLIQPLIASCISQGHWSQAAALTARASAFFAVLDECEEQGFWTTPPLRYRTVDEAMAALEAALRPSRNSNELRLSAQDYRDLATEPPEPGRVVLMKAGQQRFFGYVTAIGASVAGRPDVIRIDGEVVTGVEEWHPVDHTQSGASTSE